MYKILPFQCLDDYDSYSLDTIERWTADLIAKHRCLDMSISPTRSVYDISMSQCVDMYRELGASIFKEEAAYGGRKPLTQLDIDRRSTVCDFVFNFNSYATDVGVLFRDYERAVALDARHARQKRLGISERRQDRRFSGIDVPRFGRPSPIFHAGSKTTDSAKKRRGSVQRRTSLTSVSPRTPKTPKTPGSASSVFSDLSSPGSTRSSRQNSFSFELGALYGVCGLTVGSGSMPQLDSAFRALCQTHRVALSKSNRFSSAFEEFLKGWDHHPSVQEAELVPIVLHLQAILFS